MAEFHSLVLNAVMVGAAGRYRDNTTLWSLIDGQHGKLLKANILDTSSKNLRPCPKDTAICHIQTKISTQVSGPMDYEMDMVALSLILSQTILAGGKTEL